VAGGARLSLRRPGGGEGPSASPRFKAGATLSLAGPGSVFRWLGARHHRGRAALGEVLPAWRRTVLGE
jgi:hypothetical protein